jgi:hypothetical protein
LLFITNSKILKNCNIHPNIHPMSNAPFSIQKRSISRKACQVCAWGAQLTYPARRANEHHSAAAFGRRKAGACPGERARGSRQASNQSFRRLLLELCRPPGRSILSQVRRSKPNSTACGQRRCVQESNEVGCTEVLSRLP